MATKVSRPRVRTDLKIYNDGVNGHAIKNKILLRLPASECAWVLSKLAFMEAPTHTVLNEAEQTIKFAYFINSGLASILNVMEDGKSVEVGLIGSEGFVGAPLLVGFRTSATRAIIQVAGTAFRISAKDLTDALTKCPVLEKHLQRHSQELGIQVTQVAACNRLHEVEERLARWLLMSQDRINSDVIPLTQEFLAHMLGTRRASVTVAAGILQKAGLIAYKRSHVTIKNRSNLEDAACQCYQAIVRQTGNWHKESQ